MRSSRLMIGAMSGTSADGVDVALVRVGDNWPRPTVELLAHHHLPYSPELKRRIFAVRDEEKVALGELGQLGREITLAHAQAINEVLESNRLSPDEIATVAAHGQTLFHAPPITIQWLDPALLAARVGCAVVSDFRRADCAAGGQGAPLVPFADWVMYSHQEKNRVLLNLGGIANITCLRAGAPLEKTIAFDTGPANCISDWLMRTVAPESRGFDADGALALRGIANEELVERVLAADYFQSPPPKSTDGPAMIQLFREAAADKGRLTLEDQFATACRISGEAVLRAIQSFVPGPVDELIVSGGGARNQAMMNSLVSGKIASIQTAANSDAKEAIAFALLGAATLEGIASNVPRCTGANRSVALGSVTPKP